MAAKKSSPKAAGKKAPANAAKAPASAKKKATAAAKAPAAGKVNDAKKTAPAKPAPKKVAPSPKKSTPDSKAASAKKASAPAPKKAAPAKSAAKPVEKTAPKKVEAKAKEPVSAPVKKEVAEPKKPVAAEPAAPKKAVAAPAKSNKSSLVDYPVPPPPVKPPFVPPKAAPVKSSESAAGANGSHSPAFVQKQRQRLLDLRDELVDAMSGMTRDTIRNAPEGSEASGSGMHQGDAGSDAYDRDFALSVLAKEQDALYEIEQALRRIQAGTYGICEISNRKIPQARLEVIPFARLTVEEQAQWEKEYGNRRFRPSNEVGFSGGNTADDEDSDAISLDEDED